MHQICCCFWADWDEPGGQDPDPAIVQMMLAQIAAQNAQQPTNNAGGQSDAAPPAGAAENVGNRSDDDDEEDEPPPYQEVEGFPENFHDGAMGGQGNDHDNGGIRGQHTPQRADIGHGNGMQHGLNRENTIIIMKMTMKVTSASPRLALIGTHMGWATGTSFVIS